MPAVDQEWYRLKYDLLYRSLTSSDGKFYTKMSIAATCCFLYFGRNDTTALERDITTATITTTTVQHVEHDCGDLQTLLRWMTPVEENANQPVPVTHASCHTPVTFARFYRRLDLTEFDAYDQTFSDSKNFCDSFLESLD